MKILAYILCLLLTCMTVPSDASITFGRATPAAASGPTNYTQDANCMGAWYMNSADTETDRSGNGNTLTESASDDMPTSATVPSGYSGTSRDFEVSDGDWLEIADGTELDINGANAEITVAAWVRLEYVSGSSGSYGIVCKTFADGNNHQYYMLADGQAENEWALVAGLSGDGAAVTVATGDTTDLSNSTWYHVAFTCDDIVIKLYVNGVSDLASPASHTAGIADKTAKFAIGAFVSGYSYTIFDGLVDEPIVFDRALSASEILELYQTGIDGTKGAND